MIELLVGGLIGLMTGLGVKFFYDEIKQPTLKINDNSNELEYVLCTDGNTNIDYWVCRIFVYNRKKLALNSVANNCIAWITSTNRETKEQISWIGGPSNIVINVDDYQKVNLFAIQIGTNNIFFGTEQDIFPLRQPHRNPPFEFNLKITCANGLGDTKRIRINNITGIHASHPNVDITITDC